MLLSLNENVEAIKALDTVKSVVGITVLLFKGQ